MLCARLIVCVSACAAAVAASEARAQTSREIYDATGVRGGLVVHLGCGDGKLTAALRAGEGYLVHGLDHDAAKVEAARKHVREMNLYGPVSVDRISGNRLPYINNVVNLVVAEDSDGIPTEEVLRVLCPNGVAYIKEGGKWAKTVKPRPKEIDEWTHFLHDADNNAVARDSVVGPPRRLQWMTDPQFQRAHHPQNSLSALVSTGGRIFYVIDEGAIPGPLEFPRRWSLLARDAFNGTFLWRRPIQSWAGYVEAWARGPDNLPRLLVAVADRVYAALGLDLPIEALDAATGQTVRAYEGSGNAEEILVHEGVLLVVTGSPKPQQIAGARKMPWKPEVAKTLLAFRADSGALLWKKSPPELAALRPLTLAARGQRVFFADGASVACVDLLSGREVWRCGDRGDVKPGGKNSYYPSSGTLVAAEHAVVMAAPGGRAGIALTAYSADGGRQLWQRQIAGSHGSVETQPDVFVIGGLVWAGRFFAEAYDLLTGEPRRANTVAQNLWTHGHHPRCYRCKATERYIIAGRRAMEFMDLVGEDHSRNNWARGTCQYGVMPCNGLIYAPPNACGCYMEALLHEFYAWAPKPTTPAGDGPADTAERLERSPASPPIPNPQSPISQLSDWPTFRHDVLRSGSTAGEVPLPVKSLWQVELGGPLSAPVVADGKVFVSSVDTHRVLALDAKDGRAVWTFTAGGRVDSPPTVWQGLALFGCADGYVYCLRAADGTLVWRSRAAPSDRRTVVRDRIESVWPVHGSVLVMDAAPAGKTDGARPTAYVAAGRSSYLDGGIWLYGLDPRTGEALCTSQVQTEHPRGAKPPPENIDLADLQKGGAEPPMKGSGVDWRTYLQPDQSDGHSMAGATTDILVSDGTSVYMRQLRFDRQLVPQKEGGRHFYSTKRLIDDTSGNGGHRAHWIMGTADHRRIPVAYSWMMESIEGRGRIGCVAPFGMLLAFDERTVWGFGSGKPADGLFAMDNRPFAADEKPRPDFAPLTPANTLKPRWTAHVSGFTPRALVRAGKTLFLAGAVKAVTRRGDPPPKNTHTGVLGAYAADGGEKLAEVSFDAPPAFGGMAAAGRRLFLVTMDGKVLCFGGNSDKEKSND